MTAILVSAIAFMVAFVIAAVVLTLLSGRAGERGLKPKEPRARQVGPRAPSQDRRARPRQPRASRQAPGHECNVCGAPASVEEGGRLWCSRCYRNRVHGEGAAGSTASKPGVARRGLGLMRAGTWTVAEWLEDSWDRLRWEMERRRQPPVEAESAEVAAPEANGDSAPETAAPEVTEVEPQEPDTARSDATGGRSDVEEAARRLREMVQESGAEVEVMSGQNPARDPAWQIVLLGTGAELRRAVEYVASNSGASGSLS